MSVNPRETGSIAYTISLPKTKRKAKSKKREGCGGKGEQKRIRNELGKESKGRAINWDRTLLAPECDANLTLDVWRP